MQEYLIRTSLNFTPLCIRPILEYASTVFNYALPKYEIERVQKRALRIVYSFVHYKNGLIESGFETLYTRRNSACKKFFNDQILPGPRHKLTSWGRLYKNEIKFNYS